MSIPDAIQRSLAIMKQSQGPKVIADGRRSGGALSNAKHLDASPGLSGRALAALGLALGAVLSAPAPIGAQAAKVTVQVEGGGRPIIGARVALDSSRTTTGPGGLAVLSVAPGARRLTVAAIGWLADSVLLHLAAGTDTAVIVRLAPAPAELEELIVSITRTPRRVEDEPLRVEVLDTEEIEEKQLMTPGDIVMMLNETGGVRVQTSNPALGGAGIRIRGLGGRYTQVLADGLPLFGERIGAFGPLQIPPLDLGRVELIKGVASALFGGSALGGVINLVSRLPEAGSSALLNVTTVGGTDATTYLGGRLGRGWSQTVLAGVHTQPKADRDADGWADVPGYQRAVVRPRLFWRDSTGQSLLLTAGAMVETRTGGTVDGAVVPDGFPFPERLASTRLDAGLVGRFAVSSADWLSVRSSGTSLRHRHRFGDLTEPDRHLTGFGEVTLGGRHGGLDLVAGLAVAAERYRSARFPDFDYRFVTPAVFGQVERSERWGGVAISARLDDPPDHRPVLSPRASLLMRLADGWSVRASLGSGFTLPTPLIEETDRIGLARVAAPRGLVPERAVSGALDLHGAVGPVELNASLFGARIAHPVRLDERGATLVLVNAVEPVRSAGTDLSAVYRRNDMAVTASYTFVAATEGRLTATGRRDVPLTPQHSAGLVGVRETEKGRLGLEIYYTGGQPLERNPVRGRSPPFVLLGMLGERRIGRVRVFLNAENLTDVRQTDLDPLVLPSRAADGSWTTEAWGPLDGRVLNAGVRWSW